MKKLIAGNWKMNGTLEESRSLIADVINSASTTSGLLDKCDLLVCPPFLHIGAVRHACYGFAELKFGAQDCSRHENGAHTGDISASMLKDSKCSYVILGHSERRQFHAETSEFVARKASWAHKAGLEAIICVGETHQERENGHQNKIIAEQLKNSIPLTAKDGSGAITIAYEPVWAIGTGNSATPEDARTMHAFIREELEKYVPDASKIRILYGGSMKPDNAAELLHVENVDGGLIGGASLNAKDFLKIAKAV